MQKSLMFLDELQAIDLKLDGFKGEKESLLAESALLDGKVSEAEAAISSKQEEMALVEAEKAAMDENLAAETDNITRSDARLKEIKTQKEYQAVSKEITTAKKLKSELEDQVLQKIGRAEELKAELTVMETDLGKLQENIDQQKSEVREKINCLELDIAQDVKTRESLLSELSPGVIKRYTQLREQRRGIAVVEARAGSCLGCNMNLPPQLYNSLFRCDQITTCPHCQRILVLRQELKQ